MCTYKLATSVRKRRRNKSNIQGLYALISQKKKHDISTCYVCLKRLVLNKCAFHCWASARVAAQQRIFVINMKIKEQNISSSVRSAGFARIGRILNFPEILLGGRGQLQSKQQIFLKTQKNVVLYHC